MAKPDGFYTNNKFTIEDTIQSQYSASPVIQALIKGFNNLESADPGIKLLLEKMVDPDTAEGAGLDVWGRIVALERGLTPVVDQKYLGFKPVIDISTSLLDNFNNAVFHNDISGNVRLSDSAYRTYIFIKALINISTSSLGDINRMIRALMPKSNIKIIRSYAMELRVLVLGKIDPYEYRALLTLPWLPTGVGINIYHIETPTFGFRGQGLHTFNTGTFSTNDPIYDQL